MSDETFRQERKKIDPSEFGQAQAVPDAAETMEQVHAFQRSAGRDIPGGPAVPVRPLEGRQVTGNLPPAIQQLMQQQAGEQFNPQAMPSRAPQLMATGNHALDELIAGINSHQYEEIRLPSLGRFYNGGLPADGVLHVRPMTGREEQILATQRHVRRGSAMNMIFKNCIREQIDVEQLLVADRTYLLIYLRGISYGEYYDVSIKCAECGANFEYSINLNDPDHLHVNYCPDNLTIEDLADTLPHSGYRFRYRLPTGRDEAEVNDYRERRTRQVPDSADDTFLHRASLLIQSIGNQVTEITDAQAIKTLLQNMVVADVNHIRNVLQNPPFGVDTEVPVLCNSCLCEFKVELPMEAGFFFPKKRRSQE